MAHLVNMLIPSVRDARVWLMKAELHLNEEGKEPFIPGWLWVSWLSVPLIPGHREVGSPITSTHCLGSSSPSESSNI